MKWGCVKMLRDILCDLDRTIGIIKRFPKEYQNPS